MTSTGQQRTYFDQLPPELVQFVLYALPDVDSLRTAVHSCSRFYHVFQNNEDALTHFLLTKEIDPQLLPTIEAAVVSSKLQTKLQSECELRRCAATFASSYLRQRYAPVTTTWSLSKALRLHNMFLAIDWFALRLFASLRCAGPLSALPNSPPTLEEQGRAKRALCYYEIYCNMFRMNRENESALFSEQRLLFFQQFAPWEREQLSCVHDFLVRLISPAFNDVAEHDIVWGLWNIPYDNKLDNPYVQHILSSGLRLLRKLIEAETYRERYELLTSDAIRAPRALFDFLHAGLSRYANDGLNVVPITMEAFEDKEIAVVAMFSELDPGPRRAWHWAHQHDDSRSWVYKENQADLRRWGYVIWDNTLLESTGLLESPWVVDDDRAFESQLEEDDRERSYMQNSWEARENMYKCGGTGWWSWGDQSQVVYEKKKTALDQREKGVQRAVYRPARVAPNSLEEAREALRLLVLPATR